MTGDQSFPLSRIVIAGDTLAGWMSAAMLGRIFARTVKITVCPVTAGAEAPAPLLPGAMAALPSLCEFHAFLGVDERDLVRFCRATFRLGTHWRNWTRDGADFVCAFGETGAPVENVAFHQAWTRARSAGESSAYDRYSLGARAARLGRFAHPSAELRDIRATYRYGLHLDTQLYADYMRRFAVHCGAEAGAPLADVIADRQTGRIDAVTTKDGVRLEADLYLDCSGPDAILLDRLDPGAWREFPGAPPQNRIAWTMADGDGALSLTACETGAGGWRSVTPLQDARCILASFNAAQTDDGAARAWLGAGAAAPVVFAPIRRRRRAPWCGNVVAIGDAACELDPLEAPALRIIEAGLTALRELLPATHDDCGERDEYNRIMANVFERFHDFQMLHYERAPEGAAGVTLSAPLQLKIAQFESRGRLVQYDEESFPPESWIACLIGHGVIPRRCDPLIDPIPEDALKARLAAMRRAVDDAAKAMPGQLDYLKRAGAVKPERAR